MWRAELMSATLRLRTYVLDKEVSTVRLPGAYDDMNVGKFETMIEDKEGFLDYQVRSEDIEEAVYQHGEAIKFALGVKKVATHQEK